MAAASTRKHTIVRALTARQLPTMRLAFRVLERLSPGIASRWALRLWCTVPRSTGRRRDEQTEPGDRAVVTLDDGRLVVVETWGFGPPVYLIHGWGGWRGQLGAFIAPLVAAGHRVVAMDAPSHGDSGPGVLGPRRATALELSDALTAAVARYGKPAAVIAHSLGCLSTAVAVHDGLPVRRLAFIAPAADVNGNIRVFVRFLGLGRRTRSVFIMRLERLAGRPLSDFDIAVLARRATLPPALMVHDRDDKEIPYTDGSWLASIWPEAELVTTKGLGHQRILRDRGVVDTVVGYITAA